MLDRSRHLSEHFLLGEFTKTNFKTEDNNEPPLEAVENMIDLCENWLEELRYQYNMLYVLHILEDYDTSPILYKARHLFYQSVTLESHDPDLSRRFAIHIEAMHHILHRKLIRQAIESLDGFLLALPVHGSLFQLVVEIHFCHGSEVVLLTSILDVND